jgi:hypothetical protein
MRLLPFLVVLLAAGCAALTQLAPLYPVDFSFDRVSNVRIAGMSPSLDYASLTPEDLSRLASAVARRDVPVDLVVHIRAVSPNKNQVNARMPQMEWSFFVEDSLVVRGTLAESFLFEPGKPADIPLPVSFDAYDVFGGRARDLYELGLAIAGVPGHEKEIRVDIRPTIETGLGPILYATPITLRRTVGG